jgi:hypothetical protein
MWIREAQKHMDPTDADPDLDADPQHCFKGTLETEIDGG